MFSLVDYYKHSLGIRIRNRHSRFPPEDIPAASYNIQLRTAEDSIRTLSLSFFDGGIVIFQRRLVFLGTFCSPLGWLFFPQLLLCEFLLLMRR